MDVVVVLPTYNEAATLESVVTGIVAEGAGVLVVDDASPDGTGRVADRLADRNPAVAVFHRPAKDGLGPALAAGHAAVLAMGPAVVAQMDADGSHDPADLPRLVEAVDRGAGLAVGSRYVTGGSSGGLTPTRAVLSRLGNAYARAMLGLGVRDATSGFRAYRAEALARLELDTAAAQGYAFQIEATWRCRQLGIETVEVPITFRPRRHGSSKMSARIPLEALRLVTGWGLRRLAAGLRPRRR